MPDRTLDPFLFADRIKRLTNVNTEALSLFLFINRLEMSLRVGRKNSTGAVGALRQEQQRRAFRDESARREAARINLSNADFLKVMLEIREMDRILDKQIGLPSRMVPDSPLKFGTPIRG